MDHSTPCAGSVCEENSSKLDVYSCEEDSEPSKYREHTKCTSSCIVETAESMLLEVLDVTSVSKKDDLMAVETGKSPARIMQDFIIREQSSGLDAASVEDETVDSKEIRTWQEFSQSVSIGAKLHKGLRKCVTFPCSAEVHQKEGSSSKSVEGQNSSEMGSSCERSKSLPASFKLVSAMKGSRAQNGISPSEMLNVKWAPEVYDPPATSVSHTVNNHRQRAKAKKKDKHKYSKGKSSRGSGKEKKNVNRRNTGNIPDPFDTRNLLQLNGGYANGQEAMCRTSFLEEGLANLHLSIGEAS